MIVSFTGTQVGMTNRQKGELRNRLKQISPILFVHGGCIGADNEADVIAASEGIDRLILPGPVGAKRVLNAVFEGRTGSRVTIQRAKPYLVRNKDIVNSGSILIACPRTATEQLRSGTWMTIRYANRNPNIKVRIIEP